MDPSSLTIVVTRDARRTAPLAARLAGRAAVVALPVTETAPAGSDDRAALQAALDRCAVVAVASATAVDVLAAAVAGRAAPPVVAVGAATQAALARHGLAAEQAARGDATGLADALLARGDGRVLWLRAEDGREEGLARLAAAGVVVDAVVAYRTVRADPGSPEVVAGLAALAGAAACCLYAPSQVDALDALLPGGVAALTVPLVAIGETTAAALRARGARVAAVAASPDADAMASAVGTVLPPGA